MELTPEQIALLLALAGAALNETPAQVAARVKADNVKESDLKKLVAETLSAQFEEGESKGIGLIKAEVKKTLGIKVEPTLKTVPEIVKAINTAIVEKAEAEPDEAKIKASEVYKALEGELIKKEGEIETLNTTHAQDLVNRDVDTYVEGLLPKLHAIVPEDAGDAALKLDVLKGQIKTGYTLERNPAGGFFVKKGDQYEKNAIGHKLTVDDLGEKYVKALYGIKPVEQRKSANPQKQNPLKEDQNQDKKYEHFIPGTHGKEPTNQTELNAIMLNDNVPGKAKMEAKRVFLESQQAA